WRKPKFSNRTPQAHALLVCSPHFCGLYASCWRMRIGVVGTGVAGSLFVAAAKNIRGITVQAFDRIPANNHDEAGTGLNIGPNALKALRLNGGLGIDQLRAASLPWRKWLIALTNGTKIVEIDLMDLAEEPGLRIRWSQLYRVLRSN